MRFFHLSDLHIGKQLHFYNLKEDQEVILAEVVSYARQLRPDVIVIAGDIYDKTVPSAEAVTVFDHFLTELSKLSIPVLAISGNHDSARRLEFAGEILRNNQIYLVGTPPAVRRGMDCKSSISRLLWGSLFLSSAISETGICKRSLSRGNTGEL